MPVSCRPNIIEIPIFHICGKCEAPSAPVIASMPEYDVTNTVMCEAAPLTGRVLILTRILETAPPGTAPVVEAYSLPSMAPYAGAINALVQCPDDEAESDAVYGCAANVPYTQWVMKTNGKPTGVVYFTNAIGALITPAPVGWAPGPCSSSVQLVGINGYPTGGTHTFVANLKAFTIQVTCATVANPVTITWPGGTQTVTTPFTWRERVDGAGEFITGPITVSGNANTSFNVDWRNT
jgi:hypothetical protein